MVWESREVITCPEPSRPIIELAVFVCALWVTPLESDGLQIIHAVRNHRNQSQDTQEQKHDRNR